MQINVGNSAPTTGKHYVGGSLPSDRLPENLRNGVSRSRCGFCSHFQLRGWIVIKMIHVCKLKKSNTSERIVPEFDNEDKTKYFILYTIALLQLVCPDVLSLVGDPLSGDGCGSSNHVQFQLFPFYLLFYLFILFLICNESRAVSSQTNKSFYY